MDFTNFDFEEFFGFGDDSNPLMMLIWIIPIIIFVFYGQRIQLLITSGEIKKSLKKLEEHRNESKTELIKYIKNNLKPKKDPASIIDRFLDYFTIGCPCLNAGIALANASASSITKGSIIWSGRING